MRKIAIFEYVKRMNKEVLSCCHDSGTKKKQKTKKKHPHDLQAFKSEAAVRSL